MRERLVHPAGMTIAEILIAVAIIGIGLVALASAIPLGAYSIQEGSRLSTAVFLANQRMEQVRNVAWLAPGHTACPDQLGVSPSAASPPTGSCGVTFPDEIPVAPPFRAFDRIVRITDCGVGAGCAEVADAALRQVSVTVSYRPMTGAGLAAPVRSKAAILTTYIARR
jgi:prepilin-type N-terminal cleavage/methylation domain-containing protein